jgi:hypothetical protein
MTTWNNRVVNRFVQRVSLSRVKRKSSYEIKEVHYDENDKPYAYGGPCLGSETVESLREVVARLHEAFDNPVLDAKDFKNAVEEERLMHKLVEERLMHKWVDEDYPEATDEQKANLVKLFKEV